MFKCINCTFQRNVFSKLVYRSFGTSVSQRCQEKKPPNPSPSDFVPVYTFPYIRGLSIINRLKIYQTIATGLCLPAFGLYHLNMIPTDAFTSLVVVGLTGCSVLYSLGFLTSNFIGKIYYNEKTDTVQISYSDSWGNRRELFVPTSDIVPLNDLPVTPLNGLFLTFKRYSTKETLKLNIQFAIILDKERMKKIM